MLEGFAAAEVSTGETTIFTRSSGSGPPLLLLRGFPQTHVMWRGVAPRLAHSFTVVCMVTVMERLFPEEIPVETAEALNHFFSAKS
jgi:pimeloyl-ACP methyl ester carboxylesterase